LERPPASDEITHRIFFFANPISGSQQAAKFLLLPQADFFVPLRTNDKKWIHGHIFNVLDAEKRKHAFE
jgi:hypothetical protein